MNSGAKFPVGRVVATPAALQALAESGQQPEFFLDRHVRGEWGDVSDGDWQANQDALIHGDRLLSAYKTLLGSQVWIITEADRSATTILLPDEY